jgi:hypothetical protein
VTAKIAIELRKISLHTIQASIQFGIRSHPFDKRASIALKRVVEQHPDEDGNNDGGKPNDLVHYPSPLSIAATATKRISYKQLCAGAQNARWSCQF